MQYIDVGNFIPPKGKFVKNYFQDQVRAALASADVPLNLHIFEEYSFDDPLSAGQWKRCYVFAEFTKEVKGALRGVRSIDPDSDTRRHKMFSSRGKGVTVATSGSRLSSDVGAAITPLLGGSGKRGSAEEESGGFFHVSSKRYRPGATVKGYWDSMEDTDTFAEVSMEDLEEELEAARPPSAVSRRGAAFLFTKLPDAVKYRDSLKSGSKIYVVEPVGGTTKADMRGIDAILQAMDEGDARKTRAEVKRYWSGKPNGGGFPTMWEVMATSAKVVKQVREGQNESIEGSFEALAEAVFHRLLGLF